MVLIFGWGAGETRDLGEVAPLACPNCHNQVFMHQIHSEKRVSLYFVPVMPYGSNEYLACPICRAGLEIGPQHKTTVDAMRISTRIYQQGGMAPDEYRGRVDGFWTTMGLAASAPPAAGAGTGTATASAQPGAPPRPGAPTMSERLQNLGSLHAQGVLTDEEFAAAKRRVLEE